MAALDGVDLILHCGDLECLGVLDYLETIAPVLAVRDTRTRGRLAAGWPTPPAWWMPGVWPSA